VAPTPPSSCASTAADARALADAVADSDPIAPLESRLGHVFTDRALLVRALTHASYAAEHPEAAVQEPLAFVGDAARGLVVAEHLLRAEPAAPVGRLTPSRAALVADDRLARWGEALELGPLLRLGRGADRTGGRTTPSILATTLEAVLGALYLDAGLPAVRRVVVGLAGW
jgi:ribonuclease III